MTKLSTAAFAVPEFVTVAGTPAGTVVTVPMLTVAAAPAGPVAPEAPPCASRAQAEGAASGLAPALVANAIYVLPS
jgi:hypothetical protein